MHYFITGGAGFIASHLCERLLAEGHQITIIDDFNDYYDPAIKHHNLEKIKAHIRVIEGDICDLPLLEQTFAAGGFDQVIHTAARAGVRPSIENPGLYIRTNVDGTFNLLEACRRHGVKRFTFASSSAVYGLNSKVPFAEDDPILRTISPYAATKLFGEQICSNYAELFDIHCQCLRFFTVYGPRQRPDLAISKFTRKILQGEPIQQYGDGSTARDYTYIDDIINGVVAAANYQQPKFEIFNLGGSATTTLSELIALIEAATGRTAIIEKQPDQPGDVPRTFADVTKANKLLGYTPQTPIAAGIRKYVDWLKQQNSQ